MSVRSGREFLAIPGPTNVPDEVLNAMHRPAIEIYSGGLVEITATCLDDLRRVFGTAGRTYIYAANGHGAWEAAVSNTLSRGDKVLVLESGRFAIGWGEMASMMGVEVEILPGDSRRAVDMAALEARLRQDADAEITAVMVVQVDTASSVFNDIPAVRKAMDALVRIPMAPAIDMDDWGVDIAVAGSQKGLMTPPGLSFVAAGDKAVAAHQGAGLRTRYWDWTHREGKEHYHKYCGTPPEHLLFGLRKALDMIFEEGLEKTVEWYRAAQTTVA